MVNGAVAAPALAIMTWIASQPRIMGEFTIGLPLKIGGWLATAVVAASVLRWPAWRRWTSLADPRATRAGPWAE